MDHAVVQRWLRQILGPYAEADRVYGDVDRTLTGISSLAPKTEVYTYDDGRTQLLLVLTGTVPISYRTATYNIPVAIWIPRNYPREPPIVYVTPTNDMLVRKGPHVDPNGRVEGEYVQRWQRKWEACNLLDLIHDCQSIFGQQPPVYAKPRNVGGSGPSSSAAAAQRQSPPVVRSAAPVASPQPHGTINGASARERGPAPLPMSVASPVLDGTAPLRPPKPGEHADMDRVASQSSSYSQSDRRHSYDRSPSQRRPTSYVQAADIAPHQPTYDEWYTAEPTGTYVAGPGRAGQTGQRPMRSGADGRAAGSYDQRHTSWNGPTRQNTANFAPPPARHSGGPYRSASLSSTGSRDPPSGAAPPLPPMPMQPGHAGHRGFDEQIPASTSLPAPPRPPNPELLHVHALLHAKLQHRIHHIHTTTEESNAQLRLLSDDLDRGDLAIKDELARLEAVRDVCRATGDELQRSVEQASQRLEELRAKEEPDIDGLLSATSLVGNQLIDLVAEDNAIEDTLYHLGRALNAEILDLDRFLKQTRFLAREQFMRRALAMKICRGMGWSA